MTTPNHPWCVDFPYGVLFHGTLVAGHSMTLDKGFCLHYVRDKLPLFWRIVPLPFINERG